MAAPAAVAAGLGLAVTAAALGQAAWSMTSAAGAATVAAAAGARHMVRAKAREQRRAARRERALRAPLVRTADVPVQTPAPLEVRAGAQAEALVEAPADAQIDAQIDVRDVRISTRRIDPRIDTGQLQRIWDLGEAPDTGPVTVVTQAPPGKQAVLVGVGTTKVPTTVLRRRPRVGTADARVFDALVRAESDELTRMLELPSGRGRRAAASAVDEPVPSRPQQERQEQRLQRERRGRHAA